MVEPRYVGRMPINRLTDVEATIDMVRLRSYRLTRTREQLKQRNLPACLLFDPINIRYSTGVREFPLFSLHVWEAYAFIPVEGPVTFFGANITRTTGLETISEFRPNVDFTFFLADTRREKNIEQWADEIADLMTRHCGNDKRIAVDRCDFFALNALVRRGFAIHDGQEPLERARVIKSAEEIACMTFSIAVAEVGLARMREALRPGMTENELWSILHQTNIAMGGEWIDARLLLSGDRINPWWGEASDRMIRGGELVACDTDMIGPFGYLADISRTFYCGPGRPSARQRDMYKLALEEVNHNIELAQPGVGFREFAERAWKQPENCIANHYSLVAHGAGLCGQYPALYSRYDFAQKGYDGVIEENMTLCIESFIGPDDSEEGVKLEQQVLVTAKGPKVLSKFPLEEDLLA
jgi:Xaa-Pro dipeptidase